MPDTPDPTSAAVVRREDTPEFEAQLREARTEIGRVDRLVNAALDLLAQRGRDRAELVAGLQRDPSVIRDLEHDVPVADLADRIDTDARARKAG